MTEEAPAPKPSRRAIFTVALIAAALALLRKAVPPWVSDTIVIVTIVTVVAAIIGAILWLWEDSLKLAVKRFLEKPIVFPLTCAVIGVEVLVIVLFLIVPTRVIRIVPAPGLDFELGRQHSLLRVELDWKTFELEDPRPEAIYAGAPRGNVQKMFEQETAHARETLFARIAREKYHVTDPADEERLRKHWTEDEPYIMKARSDTAEKLAATLIKPDKKKVSLRLNRFRDDGEIETYVADLP